MRFDFSNFELKESILSLADKQNNEKDGYDIDPFESCDSLEESQSYKTQSSYTPKVQYFIIFNIDRISEILVVLVPPILLSIAI